MPFCWHPQGVYCAPKKLLGSFPSVLSTTLSPSLRSCSRLLFPRGTRVTCKEKSLPSRHVAAKTPDPKISGPAPTPVQKPALSSERQQRVFATTTDPFLAVSSRFDMATKWRHLNPGIDQDSTSVEGFPMAREITVQARRLPKINVPIAACTPSVKGPATYGLEVRWSRT